MIRLKFGIRFDLNKIKSIFLKATIDIEKCLKSMIAYYFSESHPEDYSYLNVNNFDCSKITKTVNLISGISKTIAQKEREKKSVGYNAEILCNKKGTKFLSSLLQIVQERLEFVSKAYSKCIFSQINYI